MYQDKEYSSGGGGYDSGYGYNYRNHRLASEVSLKGKLQQKYWRTKQKAIEALGKEQDEFVISGDAEVDARLEAFHHMRMTCMQLMYAVDLYQNKIFALSQDENEMGRFLREQGALDKTKAGKMMIAVGKAQSYAAQQRLCLRASLARLFAELETFRFRAIQDTQITIAKMEQARSDYRAKLLWMADISKELDPDQMKRLDKFRDVQHQVKMVKQMFDKLKADVIEKIDLLSASRCNLLSATLEPYQSAMIAFLSSTSKSYNTVSEQYQGYPSFRFQVLKNLIPNNGIADDEDEDDTTTAKEGGKEEDKSAEQTEAKDGEKENEIANDNSDKANESDEKLIFFDVEEGEEKAPVTSNESNTETSGDLLGSLDGDLLSSDFGEYTSGGNDIFDLDNNEAANFTENTIESTENPPKNAENPTSVDDLLLGGMSSSNDGVEQTEPPGFMQNDIDLLSDDFSSQSIGINDRELNNSFSSQWQSMFGTSDSNESNETPPLSENIFDCENNESVGENQSFMPSFLLDQLSEQKPGMPVMSGLTGMSGMPGTSGLAGMSGMSGMSGISGMSGMPGMPNYNMSADLSGNFNTNTGSLAQTSDSAGKKDMAQWLSLFAELDPLANPDGVGSGDSKEKQAC